ncbi:putative Homocysteine-binding domain-containing protein [Plasmopara halstedii]
MCLHIALALVPQQNRIVCPWARDDRRIWSAIALVHEQHHNLLREVHMSFLDAGADCITSNNYGVTPVLD